MVLSIDIRPWTCTISSPGPQASRLRLNLLLALLSLQCLCLSLSLCLFLSLSVSLELKLRLPLSNLLPPSLWGVSLSLFSPFLLYTELAAQIIQEEDLRCL